MRLYKKFKITLYNCDIMFYITDNIENKVKQLEKINNIDVYYEGSAGGLSFSADNSLYFIIIRDDYITYSIISHEIYHTVLHIVKDRDINDEESLSYLVGHVSHNIFNYINSKNIVIK